MREIRGERRILHGKSRGQFETPNFRNEIKITKSATNPPPPPRPLYSEPRHFELSIGFEHGPVRANMHCSYCSPGGPPDKHGALCEAWQRAGEAEEDETKGEIDRKQGRRREMGRDLGAGANENPWATGNMHPLVHETLLCRMNVVGHLPYVGQGRFLCAGGGGTGVGRLSVGSIGAVMATSNIAQKCGCGCLLLPVVCYCLHCCCPHYCCCCCSWWCCSDCYCCSSCCYSCCWL